MTWIMEQYISNFSLLGTCCMHIFILFSHHGFLFFLDLIKDRKNVVIPIFYSTGNVSSQFACPWPFKSRTCVQNSPI